MENGHSDVTENYFFSLFPVKKLDSIDFAVSSGRSQFRNLATISRMGILLSGRPPSSLTLWFYSNHLGPFRVRPRGQETIVCVACNDRIQEFVSTTNNVGVVFQLMLRLGFSYCIKLKHCKCLEANLKLCFCVLFIVVAPAGTLLEMSCCSSVQMLLSTTASSTAPKDDVLKCDY